MAAGTITLFASNLDDLNPNDLVGATVKVALVTSSYTPNAAYDGHDEWADVSANEITTAGGYAAGGATLANDAATGITGGFKYDADDVTWTAAGGSIDAWRYAVIYVSGSLWGKTSPVIGYFLGDSTPADVPATPTANNLTIQWNAPGIFDVTKSP
jgi:hypothetical protein